MKSTFNHLLPSLPKRLHNFENSNPILSEFVCILCQCSFFFVSIVRISHTHARCTHSLLVSPNPISLLHFYLAHNYIFHTLVLHQLLRCLRNYLILLVCYYILVCFFFRLRFLALQIPFPAFISFAFYFLFAC